MERKESRPRRLKVLRSIALATKGATSLPLLVLVVLGLLVFMETRIFHYIGGQTETDANACTPKVINANNIEYHSGHRYYSALKGIGALPLQSFERNTPDSAARSTGTRPSTSTACRSPGGRTRRSALRLTARTCLTYRLRISATPASCICCWSRCMKSYRLRGRSFPGLWIATGSCAQWLHDPVH